VRRASARSDDSAGGVIGGDKDYSFVATVEMLSGPPVDVAFFSAEALHFDLTFATIAVFFCTFPVSIFFCFAFISNGCIFNISLHIFNTKHVFLF